MGGEVSPEWRLAVTRRCLEEDLDLQPDADWRAIAHPVLQAFAERRGQHPVGSERITEVSGYTRAPIYSLHVRTHRAATWYDQEEGVVWLLGVGEYHDYEHLRRLAQQDRLLPTVDDYERLELDALPEDFAAALIAEVEQLVVAARLEPDRIIRGQLASRVPVRVCVETGDPPKLIVAVSRRLVPGDVELPGDWLVVVAQAFYPGVPFDELFPSPLRIDDTFVEAHELALEHPPSA
ncbi:MAG: hypothetical protein KatS3mg065_0562 [Chloroflexota bacterium]|nr:MAG: hypothetical protein KatS3mg065_0562 [Chloroflexota bacterium]